ncbi:helix-turn-helix transcriptional regulator [Bacillus infantis]|uniref:helix-turn-helix transcriptional regulator n=1 Tax=Bacillus infantis TaxID=324767 RepID=UPI003982CAF5
MIINNLTKAVKNSPYKREFIQKELGISRNTLSNWCTGKTYPSIPQALKLASILNVRIDDLYQIKEEKLD